MDLLILRFIVNFAIGEIEVFFLIVCGVVKFDFLVWFSFLDEDVLIR